MTDARPIVLSGEGWSVSAAEDGTLELLIVRPRHARLAVGTPGAQLVVQLPPSLASIVRHDSMRMFRAELLYCLGQSADSDWDLQRILVEIQDGLAAAAGAP